MKQLIINLVAILVIGLGGFFLTTPATATSSSGVIMQCSDWDLECNDDKTVCCTVCSDDGSIGECRTESPQFK